MLNTIGILKVLNDYLDDFKPDDKFIFYYNRKKQLVIKKSNKHGYFKYQLYKIIKEEMNQYNNLSLNFTIDKENSFAIYVIPKHKYIHINQVSLFIF